MCLMQVDLVGSMRSRASALPPPPPAAIGAAAAAEGRTNDVIYGHVDDSHGAGCRGATVAMRMNDAWIQRADVHWAACTQPLRSRPYAPEPCSLVVGRAASAQPGGLLSMVATYVGGRVAVVGRPHGRRGAATKHVVAPRHGSGTPTSGSRAARGSVLCSTAPICTSGQRYAGLVATR